jgi:hypothetical protein
MADIDHHRIDVRFVPILLQKSAVSDGSFGPFR